MSEIGYMNGRRIEFYMVMLLIHERIAKDELIQQKYVFFWIPPILASVTGANMFVRSGGRDTTEERVAASTCNGTPSAYASPSPKAIVHCIVCVI